MKLKSIARLCAVWCILILLTIGLSSVGYSRALGVQSEQLVAIVGRVVQAFPGQERSVMEVLKAYEEDDARYGWEVISRYGYSPERQNFMSVQAGRGLVVGMNCLIVTGIVAGLWCLVAWQERRYQRQQAHLIGYLRQISEGNYKIQIENMGEGKLSKLEDEIYQTTLYLRESKERHEQEKLALAQSLADISHQL
ncbi:MAG: hypothetical protein ACRCW2_13725, partial [Cellulosilyticaceae bacterium]